MSSSPPRTFTPRKRPGINSLNSGQHSTPKNLRKFQGSVETPDCFSRVHLETPKPQTSREKCDEVSNLRVAVRVRPFSQTETEQGVENIIKMKFNELLIFASKHSTSLTDQQFRYDHVFWSVDEKDKLYSSQEDVFLTIGVPLLNNAFRGFNACLFAYGQTGSGKSYSMMGKDPIEAGKMHEIDEHTGIIPRFCKELFKRVSEMEKGTIVNTEVSYFEIYNEKIHDLLAEPTQKASRVPLKVREHPTVGPYIVDLSTHPVNTYEEICMLLKLGIKRRSTAATAMNEFSSRSHSIFCVEIGQCKELDDTSNSMRSKVSLVDLAGSERLGSSFTNEEKMKQGVYINKSLLSLGKCIAALSDEKRNQFVPYRESVLTWLLKESLGGNSLTSMLATISPASTQAEESLATLRYACQARTIVNRARINESPHDRLVRELRDEVERLKALRSDYENHSLNCSVSINSTMSGEMDEVKTKLSETENKLMEVQLMWERRYMESKELQQKELLEAEKYKAELESQVRILNTMSEDVSIAPYRSNFLETLNDILNDKENVCEGEVSETVQNWCKKLGYSWKFGDNNTLTIIDSSQNRQAFLHLINISKNDMDNKTGFLKNLRWVDGVHKEKKITKSEIVSSMNQIYTLLTNLQPPDGDNQLNLLYARINKLLQSFETTLLNSIKSPPKTVQWAP